MPILRTVTFTVHCDACGAVLRSTISYGAAGSSPPLTFPNALAAMHQALQSNWTPYATHLHCPDCSRRFHPTHKEP